MLELISEDIKMAPQLTEQRDTAFWGVVDWLKAESDGLTIRGRPDEAAHFHHAGAELRRALNKLGIRRPGEVGEDGSESGD